MMGSWLAGFLRPKGDAGVRPAGVILVAAAGFAIYGAVLGGAGGWKQAAISAVKLPVVFAATMTVCLLPLLALSHMSEQPLSARQVSMAGIQVLAATGLMLVAFAPVFAYFVIAAKHYAFLKLLNNAIFAVAGVAGCRLFRQLLPAELGRPKWLWFWIGLYAFVGTQVAWNLRPFIGHPDLPFDLFRNFGGNFYVDMVRMLSGQ